MDLERTLEGLFWPRVHSRVHLGVHEGQGGPLVHLIVPEYQKSCYQSLKGQGHARSIDGQRRGFDPMEVGPCVPRVH